MISSSTLIITIVIIVVILSPFFYFSIKKRMRNAEFKSLIQDFAAQNNVVLTEFELWNTSGMAIDKSANKLVYVRKTHNHDYVKTCIDLNEIQRSRISETEKNASTATGNTRVTARLDLALVYTNKEKGDEMLEFYNSEYDGYTIANEMELAKKWVNIINLHVSKRK